MMMRGWRRKLYVQLDSPHWRGGGLSPLNAVVCVVIILATALAIVQTEPLVARGRAHLFRAAEIAIGLFFAAEYLLRLWAVAEADGDRPAWRKRLALIVSPSGLIDLLVIATTFAPFVTANAQMLRLVQLFRILRLAKLGRMSSALRYLTGAVASRRMELALVGGLGAGLLVTGATLLYWLEGAIQPDQFGSIPRALWWAVITLTTTGYGDSYPVTPAGKIVASAVALCGIAVIALPTGILAAAFSDALQRAREARREPGDDPPG